MDKTLNSFKRLLDIVAQLRNPNGGCPWDLEQTHESLKPYVIEEAFEVVDAIDQSRQELKGELGDLLLQIVLHSQIARENNDFSINEVIEAVADKMVKRHPHVFGDAKANTSDQVLKNWEQIKQKDLKADASILDGVPKAMPALLRAQRIGEKAARVGFEWPDLQGVKEKVFEEIKEFLDSVDGGNQSEIEDEFGDILFALTQLARRLNLNSEDLLNRSSNKFTDRFKKMEKIAGRDLKSFSLEELDNIWEQIKKEKQA